MFSKLEHVSHSSWNHLLDPQVKVQKWLIYIILFTRKQIFSFPELQTLARKRKVEREREKRKRRKRKRRRRVEISENERKEIRERKKRKKGRRRGTLVTY